MECDKIVILRTAIMFALLMESPLITNVVVLGQIVYLLIEGLINGELKPMFGLLGEWQMH